jgi:exodeoxyribonuclease VII small subunit
LAGVEAKTKHPPSFEDALGKLEAVVEAMEAGDVPLAALLAKFEEGSALLKICEARLKEAELKIEQLKQQKDGSAVFTPLAAGRDT